jgi:hypothetical protein
MPLIRGGLDSRCPLRKPSQRYSPWETEKAITHFISNYTGECPSLSRLVTAAKRVLLALYIGERANTGLEKSVRWMLAL